MFDFDELESADDGGDLAGILCEVVEEARMQEEEDNGWMLTNPVNQELRCKGCRLPVRMMPSSFEDCAGCGAPCCCHCVVKLDDAALATAGFCKQCAAWQRLPASQRRTAREASADARRLEGKALAELREMAGATPRTARTEGEDQEAAEQHVCIDQRAARALIGQLQRLERCPDPPTGDAERELLWRFHEELLRGPGAERWLLLLADKLLPQAQRPVRIQVLFAESLEALQKSLSNDSLQVNRQVFMTGVDGRDVLLCPGDLLDYSAGTPRARGHDLLSLSCRLPVELEFRRDYTAAITSWAEPNRVQLSERSALCALAVLSRAEEWPSEAVKKIAAWVSHFLGDAGLFPESAVLNHATSIMAWLSKAPQCAALLMQEQLLQRAAANEAILNCLYWAARQDELSSVTSGHAAKWLADFREELIHRASKNEYDRLRAAREFYGALAQRSIQESDLRFTIPFRCAPCYDRDVVSLHEEPIKRFQSANAPTRFSVRVRCANGVERVQRFFHKHEDDMRKQQQISAIVVVMVQTLLSDAQVQEHLAQLGLDPRNFYAGEHHIQTIFPGIGIIEEVPHAQNFSNVRPVREWLRAVHEKDQTRSMSDLARTFGVSSAFWFTMSFLLGLGDRHSDNVMVTEGGVCFHVDFGFWLGKDTLFFQHVAGPVRLDLKEITTVVGEDTPRAFFDTLRLAFKVLRSQVHLLFEEMCVAAELDADQSIGSSKSSSRARMRVRAWLQERCQLSMGNRAAEDWIEMLVRKCADAPSDLLRDTTHGLAVRKAQLVPAITAVISQVAQTSVEVVSGTVECLLEGRDSLASMLYDKPDEGQEWTRATECCICGRKVRRSFVEGIWSSAMPRHHCRICRRTICSLRNCSLVTVRDGLADRRCKDCRLRDAHPAEATPAEQVHQKQRRGERLAREEEEYTVVAAPSMAVHEDVALPFTKDAQAQAKAWVGNEGSHTEKSPSEGKRCKSLSSRLRDARQSHPGRELDSRQHPVMPSGREADVSDTRPKKWNSRLRVKFSSEEPTE